MHSGIHRPRHWLPDGCRKIPITLKTHNERYRLISPVTYHAEENADRGCDQRLYLVGQDSLETGWRRALSGLWVRHPQTTGLNG